MADWLVADTGGTNTRVALAGPDGIAEQTAHSFANDDFDGLTSLLVTYLRDFQPQARPRALCTGVAGPVRGGSAQLTNRDWFIDAADLGKATGAARVHLLNDLQAQGLALDNLAPDSTATLVPGQADPDGPRLVLGLGTGCNIAVVHRIGAHLFVPPAEAGHSTLPHVPGLSDLMAQLCAVHPHLPVEAALSGPGLSALHLALTGQHLPPARIIANNSADTLHLFMRLLGTVAGNLCLIHMATGGLFLIGGTARAIAPHLDGMGFAGTFTAKGPYSHIMQDIPVTLITDDNAALRGCARYLQQMRL